MLTLPSPSPLLNELYFVGTKHPEFGQFVFPEGSVVLDPWRYIPDQDGVEVVRIGAGAK